MMIDRGEVVVRTDADAKRWLRQVDLVDVGGDELGAEPFGLLAELRHEIGAHDAVGKAGIVLDVGREHQLSAGLEAFDDQRVEIRACGVDRGREARGPDPMMATSRVVMRGCPFVARGAGQGLRLVQQNTPAIVKIPPSVA